MHVEIQPGVSLFVDIEGLGHVPEGRVLKEKPTLILIHGGPGFEHTRTERPGMDLRPSLANVQCPVLAGDEDPVTPPEDAREIVAAIAPQWLAGFERFPGVGHGAWRDEPAAAEVVLRRFFSD